MSGDQGARAIIANCDHADHWFCCTDCALEAVVTALREQQGQQPQVPIEPGTWPANDLRRWFVMGAAWWEFEQTGATIWTSDRRKAEDEAERRYVRADAGVRPIAVVTKTPEGLRVDLGEVRAADRPATTPREHVADCECHPEIADARCMKLWEAAASPATTPGLEPRGCPTPGACSCPPGRADAGVSDEALARALRAEWPPHVPRSDEFWLDYAKRVQAALAMSQVSDEALARAIGDLGPARRHLQRIEDGVLSPTMPAVIREISQAIERCVRSIEAVRAALAGGQG